MQHPYQHQLFIVRHRGAPCYVTDTAAIYTKQVLPAKAPKTKSSAVLGNSYPNPAENTVTIPYTLPEGTGTASILIIEVATGRLVQQISLGLKTDQALGDLDKLKPGLYAYTLLINGAPNATKKLVIIK